MKNMDYVKLSLDEFLRLKRIEQNFDDLVDANIKKKVDNVKNEYESLRERYSFVKAQHRDDFYKLTKKIDDIYARGLWDRILNRKVKTT